MLTALKGNIIEALSPDALGVHPNSYLVLEDGRVKLTLDGVCYDGVALWQTDDERGGRVMSISAISGEGECVWLSEETIHEEETSR